MEIIVTGGGPYDGARIPAAHSVRKWVAHLDPNDDTSPQVEILLTPRADGNATADWRTRRRV